MFGCVVGGNLSIPRSVRYANESVVEGVGGITECVGGADPFQKELSVIALML
jgi:hypothetical protein